MINFDIAINILGELIGFVGGIGGLIYLYYFLKEKINRRVYLHYIYGDYEIEEKPEGKNLNVKAEMAIHNDTDGAIFLTHISGTLKYNREKYSQNKELMLQKFGNAKPTISEKPVNYTEIVYLNIDPHETIQKTFIFKFSHIFPDFLDRMLSCDLENLGGTPILHLYVEKVEKDWEPQPLNFLISAHVKGEKEIYKKIPLIKKNLSLKENFSGSLDIIQPQIEEKFWKEEGTLITLNR